MVLPGSGKSFEQFRTDDYQCRQFAIQQAGGATPNQASAASGVASAAVGTGLGAAAGAAIGGGPGAAIGAGGGLLGEAWWAQAQGALRDTLPSNVTTWAIYNACMQTVIVCPYPEE